jgi:predicted MPP superfamily phosphohydrolase
MALMGAGALSAAYARYVEPNWVDVEHVPIPVTGLTPALDGLRFAQISDIHLGEFFTRAQLAASIERINGLGVRWLLMTGDYASPLKRNASFLAAAAARLVEPLRQAQMPVYAALGNHDLWEDVDVIMDYLHEGGASVLRNEGVELETGLWLGAVDDAWSGRPDLAAALADAPPGAASILLAHEPDYFDRVLALEAPIVAQLSGHTHGGQVRLPTLTPQAGGLYSYAPQLPKYGRRYPIGAHRRGSRMVYTNRGLGSYPIPVRINCRPEITVYELQHRERFEAASRSNLRETRIG